MYAESGWMSVQIAGAVPGTISRADFIKLPPADRVVWLDEYYAYYGTFEIDEVAHVVTHHVVNSLIPYEKATALKREVAIDRNILTLLTPPRDESGAELSIVSVWKKAN